MYAPALRLSVTGVVATFILADTHDQAERPGVLAAWRSYDSPRGGLDAMAGANADHRIYWTAGALSTYGRRGQLAPYLSQLTHTSEVRTLAIG
jgi:hypothetical protein